MKHSKDLACGMESLRWSLFMMVWGMHNFARCQVVSDFSTRTVNESFSVTQSMPSIRLNHLKVVNTHDYGNEDYDLDLTQEDPDPLKFGRVNILQEAKTLSSGLRQLSNNEMKVTAIQATFNSLKYTDVVPDYQQKLAEISKQMSIKLNQYVNALRTTKVTVESLYLHHPVSSSVDLRLDCCSIPNADLRYDDLYHMNINRKVTCDLLPTSSTRYLFNPGRNLTEVFEMNSHLISSIKWQYFITNDGIHNEYPAHNYPNLQYSDCRLIHDVRHRSLLLSTMYPWRKNIVIVIDVGNSLSYTQLRIAKAVGKMLISSLSEQDWLKKYSWPTVKDVFKTRVLGEAAMQLTSARDSLLVGVAAVSSSARYAEIDGCQVTYLSPLSNNTRQHLYNFIDNLDKESETINHTMAFSVAFDMAGSLAGSTDVLVAYISRGLLSSLIEPKEVLSSIDSENGQTPHRVIINTYAVVDDSKPVMYERTFLQDVADQNFSKYHVERRSTLPAQRGKMVSVNSIRNLATAVGNPFQPFNWTISNRPVVLLPSRDEAGRGLVVSIAWLCINEGRPCGLAGFDIPLIEIVEPAAFHSSDVSYAFVVDKYGQTIVHPMLKVLTDSDHLVISITNFESVDGFENILKRITSELSGRETVTVNESFSRPNDFGLFEPLPSRAVTITYLWQHVLFEQLNETVYIVVLRVVDDSTSLRTLQNNLVGTVVSPQHLVYHRLDLLPTDGNCMHFKQLSTKSAGSLFLSPTAFVHPYEHLDQDETKRLIQGYLAYLSDVTNLISNPGILEQVRKDVLATAPVNDDWIQQSAFSPLDSYVVRRFLAMPSGVFRVYPGAVINKSFDPTKRHWYLQAMEFRGKIVLTPPYLDSGGAGYIVTISHTIYEGQSTSLFGPFDRVAAVVGMDVTVKYFYQMLVDQIPVCGSETIRCFLIDNNGYLIVHPDFVTAAIREPGKSSSPLDDKHFTQREPIVFTDILNHQNHRDFVRKKTCANYIGRTINRYYQFNTTLDGIVTNLVHGEHCASYQITPIPGTNAFLGIVNQTCEVGSAFCPCSRYDRVCLNCHRMEQTECECPCGCSLPSDACPLDHAVSLLSCPREPDETSMSFSDSSVQLPVTDLEPCFPSNCAMRTKKEDCVGVLDCEWCELDYETKTPLNRQFCGTQRICFGGVVGMPSPYNDHEVLKATLYNDELANFTNKSMPVGPVAGAIMGFFLLMALGVYCYRHHSRGRSHHCNGSLPGDGHLRDSNNDLEDFDDMKGHTNIMLSTFDNQAPAAINPATINPYFMNTTYRRPTNTPASDLGYSTMTPHGDDTSEQASTTCVESSVVAVVGRDRYRPSLPLPVSSSSPGLCNILPPPPQHSRSRRPLLADVDDVPEKQHDLPDPTLESDQTVLPSQPVVASMPEMTALLPHQFVADVQVHSVDVH